MAAPWNYRVLVLVALPLLSSCSRLSLATLPKSAAAGLSAGAGALVGGPGGAMIGGAAGSIGADLFIPDSASSQVITGFWPLLGELVEVGGWLLALVIVIPWVMGWLTDVPWRKIK